MVELYDTLNLIGNVMWCSYVPLLFSFYYLSKKDCVVKSSFISVIVLFGANSLMLGYQAMLDWYMEAHPGVSSAVNFFWYMGFAGFYWAGMKLLYVVHKKENIRIEKLGQCINFAFLAAGSLQLAQYAEIVIFNTDKHIDLFYTFGIPAINIATLITCLGYCLAALYRFHFGKKNLVGNK